MHLPIQFGTQKLGVASEWSPGPGGSHLQADSEHGELLNDESDQQNRFEIFLLHSQLILCVEAS